MRVKQSVRNNSKQWEYRYFRLEMGLNAGPAYSFPWAAFERH